MARIAFIFPGQGAQYAGMGQDFAKQFSAARLTFEEADDLLNYPLSNIIFNGPEELLKETKNSQLGIYVTSIAIHRVLQELFPIQPVVCSGLSLGEYTALTAGGWIAFREALQLVKHRSELMNEACLSSPGTMVVVMGMDNSSVEEIVREVDLPDELWIANYNCPGQIVLSGTLKGIEAGSALAKSRQAKRVLPLQVQGAFHSGLMKQAQERLAPYIRKAPFVKGESQIVMNVPGDFVEDIDILKENLINQVTHSVRWEQGIQAINHRNIDLFIEFGPGTTLTNMIKRIGVRGEIATIEKVGDLERIINRGKQSS